MAGPYYVDNVGGADGNPGTQALPWATITKVNATVTTGESVFFKCGGTFNGQITPGANGITYGAYDVGNRPIINGSVAAQCILATARNSLTIQDLRLTAGGTYGIAADGCNGITITGLEIDNANSSGIILGNGTQFVTISNCLIHHNGIGASGDRDGIGIGGGGAASHDITIQGCDIYNNWHDGIRVSMTSALNTPYNVTIKNNTVRNSTTASGIAIDACTNLRVQYNLILNNTAGVGLYTVPANVGAVENVQGEYYHNTIVGNLWGIQTTTGGGGTFNINCRNNLCQNNGVSGSSAEMGLNTLTTWVGNYNLVWHIAGGNFMYGASFMSWATWKTTVAPQEVNSINVDPKLHTDYTLLPTSGALGTGTFISGVSTTNPANIGARDAAGAAGGGYGPWITNTGIGDDMADVSKQRITTVATTVLKTTPGQFYGLMIGQMVATGVVEVYDAASVTGTPVLVITAPSTLLHNQCAFILPHPLRMTVGITIRTLTAAQDVTALWN